MEDVAAKRGTATADMSNHREFSPELEREAEAERAREREREMRTRGNNRTL